MGIFWDIMQQDELDKQEKKAQNLEERVGQLEADLEATRNLLRKTLAALEQRAADPAGWKTMCDRAREQRFSWELSAQRTIRELYGRNDD
mgnify:CR=1 FL=1